MNRQMFSHMLVVLILMASCTNSTLARNKSTIAGDPPIEDSIRAKQISDMKFGMFICWSFSTFYGEEWTPTLDKDASYFRATGCDTDQWCKTAKDAGMGYILFLSKHHDGFCLWDTKTTDKKVTNSPLGIDVLARLRKSCDKYGIKLALYFSEGDWNWPGAVDGKGYNAGMGIDPEMKKAQLKELCTQYGPIEFYWMDHAVGDGGLSHSETVEWVHQFQADCFVGFNHGEPAGRLSLRELGTPGPIGDASTTKYNKDAEANYGAYLVAEFTYPILPPHEGGAMWFYSLPEHDSLCHPAEKLYQDYLGAVEYGNIFSIDVGPDYEGKIRDIDVKTLKEVGELIRENTDFKTAYPDIPRIDVHAHIGTDLTGITNCLDLREILSEKSDIDLAMWINLGGGNEPIENTEEILAASEGRMLSAIADYSAHDGLIFPPETLEGFQKQGYVGYKIWSGPWYRKLDKKEDGFPYIDDPAHEATFAEMERIGFLVASIHIADPNGPWDERGKWLADPIEYWAEINAWRNVLEKHPELIAVVAHGNWLICQDAQIDYLRNMLATFPNLYIDLAATFQYFHLVNWDNLRSFMIEWSDRILFGTDIGKWQDKEESSLRAEQYIKAFRILETGETVNGGFFGGPEIRGLELPREVLEKIYFKNAMRLYPGVKESLHNM